MYNPFSKKAKEFIRDETIVSALEKGRVMSSDVAYIEGLLQKANSCAGLNYAEVAALLSVNQPDLVERVYSTANKIKNTIYGKRIVLFAPLYLSDYCVNGCLYCGYKSENSMARRKLSQDEIRQEVRALQKMGHKRLALEVGESPLNCPLEYILESIETIYETFCENGAIRRVNVNIAATTVSDYKKLKQAGIGTYILFQETYHAPSYAFYHPKGPKSDYEWHTEAMDRAIEAGIEDVGIGALFGLHDPFYETVAMIMHAEHLEKCMGIGPHTISVPRLKPALGVDLKSPMRAVSDEDFKKIVAVLRCAVPYTGIILSTRENAVFRDQVMALGVSQISAGSCTGVGGYTDDTAQKPQFEVGDHRGIDEILRSLCASGYIPSFCTACYREGRIGDRFMSLAKSGDICNVCQPNALITLQEYLQDYASVETIAIGEELIEGELARIADPAIQKMTQEYIQKIKNGERDFRF